MNGFYDYRLGDVCSRLSSGKSISSKDIFPKGSVPVYGGNGLRGYTGKANFTGECAIVGRQGAFCGNVRFFSGKAYMTEHAVVVCANEHHNTRYLAYLLSTMNLGLLSGQSAQPGLSVKTLGQQIVSLPSKSMQNKVVAVLSSIEDKIEANEKINHNLQQQARAIYKEWFIDFGQTSGTTPATWKHGKLKDVLQLHKRAIKAGANTTLPYLPIDTIPMQSFGVTEFRPNDEEKSSLITFQKDDIIVGAMRVYFHRVVLAPCDGITRTTCFTLSPYNSKYLSYALLTCDLDSSIDHAQNTSKGSTMPYAVWDGGMGEIEIVIPPIDVAEGFNNIVLPMLRQIQRNCEEIKLLGSLRDTLLPKLMSGEIDVSGIQL